MVYGDLRFTICAGEYIQLVFTSSVHIQWSEYRVNSIVNVIVIVAVHFH